MKTGNFFSELKRRNVYKVAVAYAVVALAADSSRDAGFSIFRNPELGRSAGRAGNDRWISNRADHRLGVRAHA